MTTQSSSFVSRRAMIAALGASGYILAAHTHVAAQDATPAGTATAEHDHPIVGAWNAWLPNIDKVPTNVVFDADGTYIEYDSDPRFGLGLGVWIPTGDFTAEVVSIFQRPARFDDEDAVRRMFAVGYVPEQLAFLPALVRYTLAYRVRAPLRNAFAAIGTMEVRDDAGNIIAGHFDADPVEGIRLVPASD